jgi:hypothetical protein
MQISFTVHTLLTATYDFHILLNYNVVRLIVSEFQIYFLFISFFS